MATIDVAGVQAVVDELQRIETDASRYGPRGNSDGLACFDFLYTIITSDVLTCVDGTNLAASDPRFHDRAFMAAFDIAFADRYFDAIGCGQPEAWQPKCWKVLLDHREDPDLSPLMFAVAGVNAHVNFDLPFAVVRACIQMGCQLDSGTNHADYQMINDIFAEHMQQLRQHFESRFARDFDSSLVAKAENLLGDLVVIVARDLAWRKALQLWRFHADEAKMTKVAKSRDRWVALVTQGLFALDRIPTMTTNALAAVPGLGWIRRPGAVS